MNIVDLFDGFYFDYNKIIDYQIRIIQSNFFFPVDYAILFLLKTFLFLSSSSHVRALPYTFSSNPQPRVLCTLNAQSKTSLVSSLWKNSFSVFIRP